MKWAHISTILAVAIGASGCSEDGAAPVIPTEEALPVTFPPQHLCHPCESGTRQATISEVEAMQNLVDKMGSCGSVQSNLEGLLPKARIITDPNIQDDAGGALIVYSNGSTRLLVSEEYYTNGYDPATFETYMFDLLRHEGAHASDFYENHTVSSWENQSLDDWHGVAWGSYIENCELY